MACNLGWWRPQRVQSQIHLGPFRPLHVHSGTLAHCSHPLHHCRYLFALCRVSTTTLRCATCMQKKKATVKICLRFRYRDLTTWTRSCRIIQKLMMEQYEWSKCESKERKLRESIILLKKTKKERGSPDFSFSTKSEAREKEGVWQIC